MEKEDLDIFLSFVNLDDGSVEVHFHVLQTPLQALDLPVSQGLVQIQVW